MVASFDPNRQGWACVNTACDGHWFRLGDALVCQCIRPRCRRVIAVVTAAPAPGLHPRALDAIQAQASRARSDFRGCVE